MKTVPRHLSIVLAFSIVCMSSSVLAAMVERVSLAPALGMVESVPAFRASVLSQISLVNSLSAQPVPTLSLIVTAVPTPTDPWHAEAARLVGALVAQPQAIALHQNELRAALGDQGTDRLKEATTRLYAHASQHPGLTAQLEDLRQGLDLNDDDAVQGLGARLSALFENSKSRPRDAQGDAVAGASPTQKKMPASWELRPAGRSRAAERSSLSGESDLSQSLIAKRTSGDDGGDQPASRAARMWDGLQALTASLAPGRFSGRVDETKAHLMEAVQNPALRGRLAALIGASMPDKNGVRIDPGAILLRLERAIEQKQVRYNSILTYRSMQAETIAVSHGSAIASIKGADIHFNIRSEVARKAPPRILAGILLHEIIHSEFGLGEVTAHLTERAYYHWLDRRLTVEDREEPRWLRKMIRFPLRERQDYLSSTYGEFKLSMFSDDQKELDKTQLRRLRRVRRALTGLASQPKVGDSRRLWIEAALPDTRDRELLLNILQDSSLKSATERDAFLGTAAAIDRDTEFLEYLLNPHRDNASAPASS